MLSITTFVYIGMIDLGNLPNIARGRRCTFRISGPDQGRRNEAHSHGRGNRRGLAVLLGLSATQAAAAPPEIDHWTSTDSHIEQDFHEEDGWCEDEDGNDLIAFDVLWTENAHGNFRGVMRNGVFYGQSTLHVEQTWTNVENEKTLTGVYRGVDKDQLVVPQDDGTFMLTILHTGPTQYYDSDGNKLFKDVGRTFFTIHVDENCDFIEFIEVDSKGHFETMDRDFCADLMEFIG